MGFPCVCIDLRLSITLKNCKTVLTVPELCAQTIRQGNSLLNNEQPTSEFIATNRD